MSLIFPFLIFLFYTEISTIILDALSDPNTHTVSCLKALLSTSFVHFIDAPSLALIMPTLEKALDQRSTETKKMAAQILGNMYALTDPKVTQFFLRHKFTKTPSNLTISSNTLNWFLGLVALSTGSCPRSQEILTRSITWSPSSIFACTRSDCARNGRRVLQRSHAVVVGNIDIGYKQCR